MTAVLRNSTMYASQAAKYVQKAYDAGGYGRLVPIPFAVTIVSPYTTADTYNLCIIPANYRVIFGYLVTNGLGASAGVGTAVIVGDSGSTSRYFATFDADLTGSFQLLAHAGVNYTPTADTIVFATVSGVAVVGKVIQGSLFTVPGA